MHDACDPLRMVVQLAADPRSVRVARTLVRGLRGTVPTDHLDRAELIVSEIVTNAIRHGSPAVGDLVEIELVATRSGVRGCVSDHGPTFSLSGAEPNPERVGGLGLRIVEKLATSWTVERLATGNRVRFAT